MTDTPKIPPLMVKCTVCGTRYDRNNATEALKHITGGNHNKNVRSTPDQFKTLTERPK